MASQIKAIPGQSVHKITSGQVVIDLQTAVKELVENSLDAGATSVEVRFKEYGLKSIEVIDNGCGIKPADYASIGLKHHTSKLGSFADLSSVVTFGFRGEAISSLCALAEKVTVVTATEEEAPMGTFVEFDRMGHLESSSRKVARQRGTTITITNLFAPLPVRRAELARNVKREHSKALALLAAYALVPCARPPGVRLTVSNQPEGGKKTVQIKTDGAPNLRGNISSLWGRKASEGMQEVNLQLSVDAEKTMLKRAGLASLTTSIRCQGLISSPGPSSARTSPDRQHVFINSRPCILTKVQKAIAEVWHSFWVSGHGCWILDFTLPTDAYDVNVSPDKRTILLHNEDNIVAALRVSFEELWAPTRSTYAINEVTSQGSKSAPNSQDQEEDSEEESSQEDQLESEPEDEPRKATRSRTHLNGPVKVVTKPKTMKAAKAPPKASKSTITTGVSSRSASGMKALKKLFESSDEEEPAAPQSDANNIETTNGTGDDVVFNSLEFKSPASSAAMPVDVPAASADLENAGPGDDAALDDTASLSLHGTLPLGGEDGPSPSDSPAISPTNAQQPKSPLLEPTSGYNMQSAQALEQDGEVRNNGSPQNRKVATPLRTSARMTVSTLNASWSRGRPSSEEGRPAKRQKTSDDPGMDSRSSLKQFQQRLRSFASGDSSQLPLTSENCDEAMQEAESSDLEFVQPEGSPTQLKRVSSGQSSGGDLDLTEPDDGMHSQSSTDDETGLRGSVEHHGSKPEGHVHHSTSPPDTQVFDLTMEDEGTKEIAALPQVPIPLKHPSTKGHNDDRPRGTIHTVEVLRTSLGVKSRLLCDMERIRSRWSFLLALDMQLSAMVPAKSSPEEARAAGVGIKDAEKAERALSRVISKADFSRMEVLGQFNLGFIIVRLRRDEVEDAPAMDELFVVDQHAADEKYNFEVLQQTTKIQSQALFRPRPLELTPSDELVAMENLNILRDNGFEVEVDASEDEDMTGERQSRLKLTAQPISKETIFDMKDLEELLHLMQDTPKGRMVRCSKARSMFAMRACRKSVMVGKALPMKQMNTILDHMGTMDQPWNCPHGRPTMRHLVSMKDVVGRLTHKAEIDWQAFSI